MLWWNLRKLKSKNPQTRIDGILKLGRSIFEEPVFQGLCQMVEDPEGEVRKAAITRLITRERGIRFLVSRLDSLSVRTDIKGALKSIYKEAPSVKQILIETLAAENLNLQRCAQSCLDEIDPLWWKSAFLTEEIRFLTTALKHENPTVKKGAITALGQFGDARAVDSLKAAKEKQPELQDHFGAALKSAEDRLAQAKATLVAAETSTVEHNCAVCKSRLDFSRKIEIGVSAGSDLLKSLGSSPYRCRSCGTFLCMNCAATRLCPQCSGNIFDQAIS